MKYNKNDHVESIKTTVTDLKSNKPTEGRVTAIADLRCLRKWLVAELTSADGSKQLFGKVTPEVEKWIKSSFLEIIQQVQKEGATEGFMSNGSAAAKAAGFKPDDTAAVDALLE